VQGPAELQLRFQSRGQTLNYINDSDLLEEFEVVNVNSYYQ